MSAPAAEVACRPSVATCRSSLELAVEPAAVRTARHWTTTLLTQALPPIGPDTIDSAVLLVSELVTNAIRAVGESRYPQNAFPKGTRPIRALDRPRVWLVIAANPGLIRIEVHDSASVPVPPAARPCGEAAAEEESGRGLEVITALASDWGWHPDPCGKVVWCQLVTD
jgi:hypothetical protein